MRSSLVAALTRHAVTVSLGVVTIATVGHELGAAALGVWALIGTSSFLLGLADLGIPIAAQRALASADRAAARRAVRIAMTAIAIVVPVLALLSLLWLVPLARAVPDGPAAAVLGTLAGVITAFGSPPRALAVVTRDAMRGLAWSRGAAAAAQLAVMVACFAIYPSLVAPALGLVIGTAVETLLVWKIARELDPELSPLPGAPRDRDEIRAIARDGSAALTINVAVAAAVRADVALVASSGTLAAVAAYGVAGRAIDQLYSLAKQVSAAALPGLRDPATRDDAVRTSVARMGGLAAAGLTAFAVGGGPLLVAWAGAAASTPLTTTVLGILAVAAIIAAVAEIPAAVLTLGDRSVWRAAVPIATGAAVNFTIGITCVGPVGPVAVALATVAGNLVNAVWTWRRAMFLLAWHLDDVVATLAPVALGAGGSLAVALAMHGLVDGVWSSVLMCATSATTGFVLAETYRRASRAAVPPPSSTTA